MDKTTNHYGEEHKALFNTLRMQWLRNPSLPVEKWQVQDYRALSIDTLFEQLAEKNVPLDRVSFMALSDDVESPEELVDQILSNQEMDSTSQDQVFLLIFELWRRLVPEKQNISLFCDELDYQIDLYEREQIESKELLEDALANLAVLLDENSEQVDNPKNIFSMISQFSAHDLESFLFDFIDDQIEEKNESYASELLEAFFPYVEEKKWLELLNAKLIMRTDPSEGYKKFKELFTHYADSDLEFHLEILSVLVQNGDNSLFKKILVHTLPLIKDEEQFQDLLTICMDFLHYRDKDVEEKEIQKLLKDRAGILSQVSFNQHDPAIGKLLSLV